MDKKKIDFIVYDDTDNTILAQDSLELNRHQKLQVSDFIQTYLDQNYKLVAPVSFEYLDKPVSFYLKHEHKVIHASDLKKGEVLKAKHKKLGDGFANQDITYQSLNRTVTRTILMHQPKEDKIIEQHVHFVRSADVDLVNGNVINTGWTSSDPYYPEFTALNVPGYIAEPLTINKESAKETDADSEVEVNYKPLKQEVKFVFIDKTSNQQVGKKVTFTGLTGTTEDIHLDVPMLYCLADSQTLPSSYKFEAENPDVIIYVDHELVRNWQYTEGSMAYDSNDKPVTPDSFKKELKRTIIVNYPDGKKDDLSQTITVHRQANFDEVTGKICWSEWDEGHFDSVALPNVKGYTLKQNYVDSMTAKPDYQDPKIQIKYEPAAQSVNFVYVDEFSHKRVGEPIEVKGFTDKTAENIKLKLPENYVVADGQSLPTSYTFNIENPDVKVYLGHKFLENCTAKTMPKNTVDNEHNVIKESDFAKKIRRTIIANVPDHGQEKTRDLSQETILTRTGNVDLVTRIISWNKWSESDFNGVTIPKVTGYTSNLKEISKVHVTANYQDPKLNINFIPDEKEVVFKYLDVDEDNKVIKTLPIGGEMDQTVSLDLHLPKHYELTGDKLPDKYHFNLENPEIDIHVKHQKLDNFTVHNFDFKDGIKADGRAITKQDFMKKLTRSIKLVKPSGQEINVVQDCTITRSGVLDLVNKTITWNEYAKGHFDNFDIPDIDGYTVNTRINAINNVDSDYSDPHIKVTYAPIKVKQDFKFVDSNNKQIAFETIYGATNEVKPTPKLPLGWENKDYPETIKLKPVDNIRLITVHVKHAQKVVDDVKIDDVIAGNHEKVGDGKPIRDINFGDLHKTVTRTIKLHLPKEEAKTIVEAVNFKRHALIDQVNGSVSFTNWDYEDKKHAFNEYIVPKIEGYRSLIEYIPVSGDIDPDKENETIDVKYVPDQLEITFKFIDQATNMQVGSDHIVHGETDEQDVVTDLELPKHYVLAKQQILPRAYNFGVQDKTVKIFVNHEIDLNWDPTKKGTIKDPVLPDRAHDETGDLITASDFSQDVKRTILVKKPIHVDGHVEIKTQDLSQIVRLFRDAEFDYVTQLAKWHPWSIDNFKEVEVPNVTGYTPSAKTVLPDNATIDYHDTPIVIDYTANQQTVMFQFVDDQRGGSQVGSVQTVHGHTDQKDVPVHLNVPENYVLADGQKLPEHYDFLVNNPIIAIHLKHKINEHFMPMGNTMNERIVDDKQNLVTSEDFVKYITRTVVLDLPNGYTKSLAQTVQIKRSGKLDLIDKTIAWNPWSTNVFEQLGIPSVDGYTADTEILKSETATSDYKDRKMHIGYKPNKQSVTYRFIDHDKHVIDKQTINGVTDKLVRFGLKLPDGYTLPFGEKLPVGYVFKAANPDIDILVNRIPSAPIAKPAPKSEPESVQTASKAPSAKQAETTRQIKRSILVDVPKDGHIERRDLSQIVVLHQTNGIWDEQKFSPIKMEDVPGYRPSLSLIPAQTATINYQDPHIVVNYTKLKQAKPEEQNNKDHVEMPKLDKNTTGDTPDIVEDLLNSISSLGLINKK